MPLTATAARYALSNPICRIADKPRQEFTREDLVRVIEERNLERIVFHYTALDGRYKELKFPVADRNRAERILAEGERVDGSSLFRGMVDAAISDLYVVPVYRTAFLNPLDEGSLDLTCRFVTRDGELAPFAPDTVLRRAAELFRRRTGAELHVAREIEFFLLSDAHPRIFAGTSQRAYHESAPFMKAGAVLNDMVRHVVQAVSGPIKYAHSEVGFIERVESELEELNGKTAEQLEIEFLPAPVEDAADDAVMTRWLIRNIAYRHGCVATFVPKLDEGVAGNGSHVHMAVVRNGRNCMINPGGQLSADARKVIGGLCTHADSLVAFGNTMSSAYLRLVPNQEAPTHICWSDMNRSAMIRVPLAWGNVRELARRVNSQQQETYADGDGEQTVELRTPDGSAIEHLLLAGITMAAEWGSGHEESLQIAEKLYATAATFQDEDQLDRLDCLPGSCAESARILLRKRALYERDGIFPSSVIAYVAKLLQDEDDENVHSRLAALPTGEQRLREARRIMHRDIHRH